MKIFLVIALFFAYALFAFCKWIEENKGKRGVEENKEIFAKRSK